MTINCAIIDDEPLAAGLLKSYAEKTPFLSLIGTYGSALEAMKQLREHPAQLLFLDIQMPELSGIEFAKILPPETKIIFTTAFQQYAIEGYKVNALDYLLKPISYDDFLKASNKALDWFTTSQKQQTYAEDRFMFVKSDYKLVRVALDDILYIEGLKDYVRIYLADGQKIMSLMSMKKLEDYLPRPEFLRTHRSYIVHMSKAQSIDRFRIVFGQEFIPISDSYKEDVQEYFDQHTLV
jgi:DNA-binding LytR/AlgR family response regulator